MFQFFYNLFHTDVCHNTKKDLSLLQYYSISIKFVLHAHEELFMNKQIHAHQSGIAYFLRQLYTKSTLNVTLA